MRPKWRLTHLSERVRRRKLKRHTAAMLTPHQARDWPPVTSDFDWQNPRAESREQLPTFLLPPWRSELQVRRLSSDALSGMWGRFAARLEGNSSAKNAHYAKHVHWCVFSPPPLLRNLFSPFISRTADACHQHEWNMQLELVIFFVILRDYWPPTSCFWILLLTCWLGLYEQCKIHISALQRLQ